MAQFDPSTIGKVHRCASLFEQQSKSSNWMPSATHTRSQEQKVNTTLPNTSKETGEASNYTNKPAAPEEIINCDDSDTKTPYDVILVANQVSVKQHVLTPHAVDWCYMSLSSNNRSTTLRKKKKTTLQKHCTTLQATMVIFFFFGVHASLLGEAMSIGSR